MRTWCRAVSVPQLGGFRQGVETLTSSVLDPSSCVAALLTAFTGAYSLLIAVIHPSPCLLIARPHRTKRCSVRTIHSVLIVIVTTQSMYTVPLSHVERICAI